jgi:hypothetical protein
MKCVPFVVTVIAALAGHAFGDTLLVVDPAHPSATDGGSCSPSVPCKRITDGLVRARAVRAGGDGDAIVINVAAGRYPGSWSRVGPGLEAFPLVMDIPKLTLQGATVLARDAGGRPLSRESLPAIATLLDALDGSPTILLASRSENGAGDHARVSGFVVANAGVDALVMDRVVDFTVENNWFVFTGCVGANSTAASGIFRQNLSTFNGCGGMASGAGNLSHPSVVTYLQNRSDDNGIAGMLVVGGSSPTLVEVGVGNSMTLEKLDLDEVADHVTAMILGNDLSRNGVTGIRMMGHVFHPTQTVSDIRATVGGPLAGDGNTLEDNGMYGLEVDPGFAFKHDPRTFTANAIVKLEGNAVARNGAAPAMFGFLTIWAMWKPDFGSSQQFELVRDSRYEITDVDHELTGFDFYAVGTNNSLTMNGEVIRGAQLPITPP